MKIRKAVIPVAGKGTRFLPATKQVPKEILPIINIPMIHYVVKEAVDSGIEQLIFVTSTGKFSIEDYFDRNLELEGFLKERGKESDLKLIREIGSMVEVMSVRQKEQLGLGHAVACAGPMIGDEMFAVILGDDLVWSDVPATKQLMDESKKYNNAPVIGVMEVPREDTNKYGIVAGQFVDSGKKTMKMTTMVEKPRPSEAPSQLATPGRYILSADIFDCLRKIPRGAGGEYQLTDAIKMLAGERDVYAHIFKGERFDTGSIQGYLNATVEFALRRDDTREMMKSIIQEKVKSYKL